MDLITTLKELQAGVNASFEAVYAAKDAKALAAAKQGLIDLSNATAGAVTGTAFSVLSLPFPPVQYMAVKIAVDLNLFDLIAVKSYTLDELVQATKANPKLLRRILRAVTAIGWLKQTEVDKWEASPLTHAAAAPSFKSWLLIHYDTRMAMYAEFPAWLKDHQYKSSWIDDHDNIWTQVNGGDCWSYMEMNPTYSRNFDIAMSVQESFPRELTPPYPFSSELNEIKKDETAITLVDMGGGAGQAIEIIKKTHPELRGRFILQDLAKTINQLDAKKAQVIGFEAQSHDFFEPQPVKNAKYYQLKRVLHNWNDEACLKILRALRPALDPTYSKLIIIDNVLDDLNPGPFETVIDLMMMTACDGVERSMHEWHALLGKAGYKIDQILRADSGTIACIEASVANHLEEPVENDHSR